jgi:Cu+-exporting ATPase
VDETELVRLVASAERGSEHPLAGAIVREAERRAIDLVWPDTFRAMTGQGIEATVEGRPVLIGNSDVIAAAGVATEPLVAPVRDASERGATPLLVAVDGTAAGVIAVADRMRASSPGAVGRLRGMGVDVVMLTGDQRATAEAVAAQAGIARVVAGMRPDGKTEIVRQLQAAGGGVAMVGDGVNDAPALAAADVGIAIGTGTDVALEAAPVTLMRPDLNGVATAIALSRTTMRTMYQNLAWAFGYNVLLIPVAAGAGYVLFSMILGDASAFAPVDAAHVEHGEAHIAATVPQWLRPVFGTRGFLNPIVAAGAMALSSVSVMANSLRLRNARLD